MRMALIPQKTPFWLFGHVLPSPLFFLLGTKATTGSCIYIPWLSGSSRFPVILEIISEQRFAGQSRDLINSDIDFKGEALMTRNMEPLSAWTYPEAFRN